MSITQLTDKAIAVQIEKEEDSFVDYYFVGTDNMLYANFGQIDYPLEVELPPGSWSLLGKASELSEDQWREVVPAMILGYGYRNFEAPEYDGGGSPMSVWAAYPFKTALESGQSLLKSKNLSIETTLILLKQ